MAIRFQFLPATNQADQAMIVHIDGNQISVFAVDKTSQSSDDCPNSWQLDLSFLPSTNQLDKALIEQNDGNQISVFAVDKPVDQTMIVQIDSNQISVFAVNKPSGSSNYCLD